MPYIKQEDRKRLDKEIEALGLKINGAGELNYAITRLLHLQLKKQGECYATHCMLDGVISGVQKEFYRKKTAPYEDEKITENGDLD
jgi:hypothetical protein